MQPVSQKRIEDDLSSMVPQEEIGTILQLLGNFQLIKKEAGQYRATKKGQIVVITERLRRKRDIRRMEYLVNQTKQGEGS